MPGGGGERRAALQDAWRDEPGAPRGKANGRYRTGLYTRELMEARALVRAVLASPEFDGGRPRNPAPAVDEDLDALEEAWDARGPEAIRTIREADPVAFVKMIARLVQDLN